MVHGPTGEAHNGNNKRPFRSHNGYVMKVIRLAPLIIRSNPITALPNIIWGELS
jgi:hypothetical protein